MEGGSGEDNSSFESYNDGVLMEGMHVAWSSVFSSEGGTTLVDAEASCSRQIGTVKKTSKPTAISKGWLDVTVNFCWAADKVVNGTPLQCHQTALELLKIALLSSVLASNTQI